MSCVKPAALTPITQPVAGCEFNFDQILRLLFQRRQPSGTPSFADEAAIKLLSNWTVLKAAVGDTKVIVSPLFSNLVIPPSEPQFEGGNDNTTIDGIEIYKGESNVKVTGTFTGLLPASAEQMRKLSSESHPGLQDGLTTYMVNRDGEIIYDAGEAGTAFNGITIYNFQISSVGSEGKNAANKYNFSFTLPSDWDRFINKVKPSFNPRFDL